MARKRTLGYVQLEWTCPNCNSRNPGGNKTCENCGAPQPENVQFERPAESKFVTNGQALKAARASPDIHCGFCGTRNPATAKVCSQCGGDLKEGKARQAGRVLAEPPPAPETITCTNCGTLNTGANSVCSNCGAALPRVTSPGSIPPIPIPTAAVPKKRKPGWLLYGGIAGAVLAACLGAVFLFFFPTSALQGTVTDTYWQTSVPVQEVQAVHYSNERGSPPSDAYDVSCETRSEEVCEQKTIDKGTGFGEVVEECRTESEQYCDYTRDEWQTIETLTLDGHDDTPLYEQPNLTGDQRVGNDSVTYTITLSTKKGQKTHNPDDLDEYQRFQIGETWTLKLNALGGIVSVEQ